MKAFHQQQRGLLMASKDLSQHAIKADSEELEDSLQRGSIPKCLISNNYVSFYVN
jgi:hypothetical protein